MKVDDKQLQSSTNAETNEYEPVKKAPDRKKDWVRFSDERRFGSISGSGIRVWGED